uniref:GED domain-containing protein n=1 Tax=Bionectria ochroleuca TaxID=29856 RepID=A0A0B7KRL1_BIOOC
MNIKPEPLSLVDSSLLEKIDALFACNLGHDVDLPQLIVVGQQSSGKSSVLEGLTGLPFPRDSSLCTRFATQIIFRRALRKSISARIIPFKDSCSEHQEKMKDWRRDELTELDPDSFAGIMREVIDLMGVGSNQEPGSPAFSKDVLVLEIADPTQEHFSVIDVPGTFKRTTQGLTTKDDIALVDNMVKGYMTNPRSVMLTVVPCNADIATQEIVEQAEDLDPSGDRTLGVLTKPDLVDKGAENDIIELIEGKRHRLKLGWHLLRNPGQAELVKSQSKSRNELEGAFFRNVAPWNNLDGEVVGVKSLRDRLQGILASHIRREFPKVKSDIQSKLRAAEKKLKGLGPARQGPIQQRQYLMKVAGEFQDIASSAINAQYSSSPDFFDGHHIHRVATRARQRAEEFAKLMTESGHRFDFAETSDEADESKEGLLKVELAVTTRSIVESDDIEDILSLDDYVEEPYNEGILDWLTELYKSSIGFELGTFSSSLLRTTMQNQSQKWRHIAKGYISDVIAIAHYFVSSLLQYIIPDSRVLEGLSSRLSDHLRGKYIEALEKTESLLRVELEGTPATHNSVFTETLNECRQQRQKAWLKDKTIVTTKYGEVVRLKDVVSQHPLQNGEQMIQEIHDILRSYYLLSRKRFIDNVRMQVADDLLITGPETPLKIFSSELVSGMTDEELDDVAGEDPSVRRNREAIQEKINLLRKAMKILR